MFLCLVDRKTHKHLVLHWKRVLCTVGSLVYKVRIFHFFPLHLLYLLPEYNIPLPPKLSGTPCKPPSMETSIDLHGAPRSSTEAHGGSRNSMAAHGGSWRFIELHGGFMKAPWRSLWSSMEAPWRSPWRPRWNHHRAFVKTSIEASMEPSLSIHGVS